MFDVAMQDKASERAEFIDKMQEEYCDPDRNWVVEGEEEMSPMSALEARYGFPGDELVPEEEENEEKGVEGPMKVEK